MDIHTPEGIYYDGRDCEEHQYDEALCGTPETASALYMDWVGPVLFGWILLSWGLINSCRGRSGFGIVSGRIGLTPILSQMLVTIPIRTWLTLCIYILHSALNREGVTRTEDGIKSKGSHKSAIPLFCFAQLFC